jgi:type VI secretion system protein ImpM
MMLTVFSAQSWYATLERIALATLNINALPDDLDRNLAENPFSALELSPPRGNAQELAAWWRDASNSPPKIFVLPTENSLADLFDATAEDLLTASALGKSFWWTVASEAGPTQLRCFEGLPPESYFASMLETHLQTR